MNTLLLIGILAEDRIVQQLTSRMAPTCLEKRMLADGSFESLPTSPCNDFDASALPPMSHEEIHAAPEVRFYPRIPHFGQGQEMKLSDVADGRMSLSDFVSALPVDDLCCLLGGQPNVGLANTFGYGNNPCIAALRCGSMGSGMSRARICRRKVPAGTDSTGTWRKARTGMMYWR